MTPRSLAALLAAATLVALPACGDDTDSSESTDTTSAAAEATTTTAAPELDGEIVVSAAASLTESFTELGEQFEAEHRGVTVTFNFDSSGTLATQIQSGAPADVFASADTTNMGKLADAGLLAGDAVTFARNRLAIVVKPGNPAGIDELDDLATAGIVSLCVETAPCGKYADQVLSAAGVVIPADKVTRGQNVKATLSAVADSDAVAGLVYTTDAQGADADTDEVEIPDADNALADYPIAAIKASTESEAAEAFVEFVTGEAGQKVLAEAGFLQP